MRTHSDNQQVAIAQAIKVLTDAGALITISVPGGKHLCLKAVAAKLDCSVDYVRDTLEIFRMLGGCLGVNCAFPKRMWKIWRNSAGLYEKVFER